MKIAIVGAQGSGKTMLLTSIAYQKYLKGVKIFSNYKVMFPHEKISSPEQIIDIKDGFASLDELWLWLDSRCSQQKKNRVLASILAHARKQNYTFGYTSQTLSQVDLRIRHICTHVLLPQIASHKRIVVSGYKRVGVDWVSIKPFEVLIEVVGKLYNTYEHIYYDEGEKT